MGYLDHPDDRKVQSLSPTEIIHALVCEHPGLITGEDDGTSGADTVDTLCRLLQRLPEKMLNELKEALS